MRTVTDEQAAQLGMMLHESLTHGYALLKTIEELRAEVSRVSHLHYEAAMQRDHARAWCHHWHSCLLYGPESGPDADERASDGWKPTVFDDE